MIEAGFCWPLLPMPRLSLSRLFSFVFSKDLSYCVVLGAGLACLKFLGFNFNLSLPLYESASPLPAELLLEFLNRSLNLPFEAFKLALDAQFPRSAPPTPLFDLIFILFYY